MSLPSGVAAQAASSAGLKVDIITKAANEHPKPENIVYSYGTAGFRTKANILDSVLFRVGIVAALRSKKQNGKTIGVMVTASHNPEEDNGVKLVDPRGEMLEAAWEGYSTTVANAPTAAALVSTLSDLISTARIDLSVPASVVYAHDTRPSSNALIKALEDGLACLDTAAIPAGLKTTPQLHYFVRCLNTKGSENAYGEPTEEGYYKKLSAAYIKLVSDKTRFTTPVTVDCSNGVGATALTAFAKHIPSDLLPLRILRSDITTPGVLNNGCGADYVKTNQRLPIGMEKDGLQPLERIASFDGDADRIVYYYLDEQGKFHLLDGDKIASLAAVYIGELVEKAEVPLKVGVVQTAYANGSSTKYLKQRVPVTCVPTGVKHLHHAAESFDVGVYFEANGHGTVLFSPSAIHLLQTPSPGSPAAQHAREELLALTELINQTVGDAISDMLLVETILRARNWGPAEWDTAYLDLPNKLVKVNVKDRSAFRTEDAERRLVSPEGLQEKIDELVGKYKDGRSFVRPSGTEDCVRVYAEAAISGQVNELAYKVAGLVYAAGGLEPSKRPREFL